MGIETRDDAGVYRLNDEMALIQTIDFFTPMVDDPYVFGQIAATNAINDIYAMGGTPLLVMNIVCYPQCADMLALKQIIEGGLNKINEAGAILVGGHSVDDNEPKYGMAVAGLVRPDKLISNRGASPGDEIFLTKPLGNGVISTAIKAGMASRQAEKEAIQWMSMLNRGGCEAMQEVGVNAATDVTGFGLLGHLSELASGSDVEVELYAGQVQFMTGTLEYANLGLVPGGAYTNRDYLKDKVEYREEIDATVSDLLYSPETAGGLLIAVEPGKAEALVKAMNQRDCVCFPVARVLKEGYKPIRIRK